MVTPEIRPDRLPLVRQHTPLMPVTVYHVVPVCINEYGISIAQHFIRNAPKVRYLASSVLASIMNRFWCCLFLFSMSQLMQHHGCRSHLRDRSKLTGLEECFDMVVDSNDVILEKVVRAAVRLTLIPHMYRRFHASGIHTAAAAPF